MELKPCPLCGSRNIECFADEWDNDRTGVTVYNAVVRCLGCHEEGCVEYYDEGPCFGIDAYYPATHPLIRDISDPEECERVLERHMAERWNHRAGED